VSGLTVLFVVLAVVLTVPVYAFAVRRLLGLRLSPLRAWIGGLIALASASPMVRERAARGRARRLGRREGALARVDRTLAAVNLAPLTRAFVGSGFCVDDDVGDRGEFLAKLFLEFAGKLVRLIERRGRAD
jgi:hypothetical protein